MIRKGQVEGIGKGDIRGADIKKYTAHFEADSLKVWQVSAELIVGRMNETLPINRGKWELSPQSLK